MLDYRAERAFERAYQEIEDDWEEGRITQEEYRQIIRELNAEVFEAEHEQDGSY